MYYFLSVLTGVIVAVMVSVNGKLSLQYSIYTATVIIHIVGLAFTILLIAIRKVKLVKIRNVSIWYYTGGAIGVITTVFNNIAFGKISISALLALSLLGQAIISIIIDQFGMFKMPKRRFSVNKLIGICFLICGIAIMVFPTDVNALIPVIVSLLTGLTVVVSRTLNAELANESNVLQSTFYNYAIGLLISFLLLMILGHNELALTSLSFSPKLLIYTGGILGVLAVTLSNATVQKISSFYMTLFLFVGQVAAGIICDAVLENSFSMVNCIGGIFVAAGLCLNLFLEKKNQTCNEKM